MNRPDSEPIVRRPRHPVNDTSHAQVQLERTGDRQPRVVAAELVDFSRHGVGLRVGHPLVVGEDVGIRIRNAGKSPLDISLPALVRWQRKLADPSWAVGCVFEREIQWEIIGELFLQGVLATEVSRCPT